MLLYKNKFISKFFHIGNISAKYAEVETRKAEERGVATPYYIKLITFFSKLEKKYENLKKELEEHFLFKPNQLDKGFDTNLLC